VIPNFVDTEQYALALAGDERPAGAKPGDIILVHTSNFRPVKRPADTVRILAAVNARRPARLLLIGDGPEMAGVLQEADRLSLRERIIAAGKQTDVHRFLRGCDVFLLPSEEESFGLAALEAMACGVPAVTSDAGGLHELIEHGQNGYRARTGDVDAMAQFVLDIVADPATLQRFRAAARRRATDFDAARTVPRYEDLYRRVLA
jgi:N-acetyl-alpha-D-glucosaminyl L-malate synthase BshA